MKLKTYMCIFATLLVVVSGCGTGEGNGKQDSKKYEAGHVEAITTAQLVEKMQNKESFTMVFTQTTCSHCKTFLEMLNGYLPNHNLVIYDMILDKEANREQSLKECETLFPEFTGTPDIYYVENGEIRSRFWNEGFDSLTKDTFNEWVEKYDLLGK